MRGTLLYTDHRCRKHCVSWNTTHHCLGTIDEDVYASVKFKDKFHVQVKYRWERLNTNGMIKLAHD